jgi:hypothetical protein
MASTPTRQRWTDYVEVDDVKRKFLQCECGQNTKNLFYLYEQKPGRVKKQGLFAQCPKCNAQIRLRLGFPKY